MCGPQEAPPEENIQIMLSHMFGALLDALYVQVGKQCRAGLHGAWPGGVAAGSC